MTVRERFLSLISGKGMTDRRLSILATGSTDTVRNIRRGSNPRTDTLEAICGVLGIEVHLSPPQDGGQKLTPLEMPAPPEILDALDLPEGSSLKDAVEAIEQRIEESLAGQALRDEIISAVKSEARALRGEIRAGRVAGDLTDEKALSAPGTSPEICELPGSRPVAVHQLQTAAGSGALDLDEAVTGYAYFHHEWLSRKGLDADRCSIIGVMGESMEPTLPEGCVILLDRNCRRRREGSIFVVRTGDGLVVKRASKGGGGWQLVSDHPRWPDAPWPDDAVIIGEVKWMAREL